MSEKKTAHLSLERVDMSVIAQADLRNVSEDDAQMMERDGWRAGATGWVFTLQQAVTPGPEDRKLRALVRNIFDRAALYHPQWWSADPEILDHLDPERLERVLRNV